MMPDTDVAETMHKQAYGPFLSARASTNAGNTHFLIGYGVAASWAGAWSQIDERLAKEFEDRRHLLGLPEHWYAFEEWRRGFYAARLQRAFLEGN